VWKRRWAEEHCLELVDSHGCTRIIAARYLPTAFGGRMSMTHMMQPPRCSASRGGGWTTSPPEKASFPGCTAWLEISCRIRGEVPADVFGLLVA
jgi:hypothetical protein